ncbi:MAG TPA: hypothetical protein VHJ76_00115 [Actinomycetota bacterium]|nr:hypothetical protein [Actinomycetota bacterium]
MTKRAGVLLGAVMLVSALAVPAQAAVGDLVTETRQDRWVGATVPYEYGGAIQGGGVAGSDDGATIVLEACMLYFGAPVFCSTGTGTGYVEVPMSVPVCLPGLWQGLSMATFDGEPLWVLTPPVNLVTCPR